MRWIVFLLFFSVISFAYSGMQSLSNEIKTRQSSSETSQLIGDLIDGATTTVGRRVRDCITEGSSCENQARKVQNTRGYWVTID